MAFGDGAIAAIDRKTAATHMLLLDWAGTLESEAKQGAPWTDRTGHTRQGLQGGVERNGMEFLLFLAHSMQTGHWLEVGTGLHGPYKQAFIIRPTEKKALFWPGAAHPVKAVLHPGMEPRAIIVPTIEANIGRIRLSLQDLWSE